MHRKKESRLSKWLWRIGITLGLLLGLALVFNEQIKVFVVNYMTQSTLKDVTKDSVDRNKKKKASYDFDQVTPLDLKTVSTAVTNASKDAIGMMAIPSVNIRVPILEGLANNNMVLGAGTMKPNQKMGEANYALAGHSMNQRYGPLLSPLDYAKVGDLIYITDMSHVYIYKMTIKETIDMSHVEVVDDVPGKKLITLITCEVLTGTEDDRIFVRGELQKVEKATNSNIKVFEEKA